MPPKSAMDIQLARLKARQSYLAKEVKTNTLVNETLLKQTEKIAEATKTALEHDDHNVFESREQKREKLLALKNLEKEIETRKEAKAVTDLLKVGVNSSTANVGKENDDGISDVHNIDKRARIENYSDNSHNSINGITTIGSEGQVSGNGNESKDDELYDDEAIQAEVERRIREGEYEVETSEMERQVALEKAKRMRFKDIQVQRRSLPIYQKRQELIDTIRNNQVVVVEGETGSGKTTQLIQYLYEEGFTHEQSKEGQSSSNLSAGTEVLLAPINKKRRLICTQPRRLAATSVADRVAVEMDVRLGSTVGYKVRFDDKTSEHTEIVFMTDGMLLKELACDPLLLDVAVVMIDEAHERSLSTDVLLGLLRAILPSKRKEDLRVILASATLQVEQFCDFFTIKHSRPMVQSSDVLEPGGEADMSRKPICANGSLTSSLVSVRPPHIKIPGRAFPVNIYYSDEPVVDFVAGAAEEAMRIHVESPLPGDVLIFLTGQDEIERCVNMIQEFQKEMMDEIRPLMVTPVYGALHSTQQRKIHEKPSPGTRKVVIATNIAETSLTVDGIVYVIDCGLVKQNFYNTESHVDELAIVPISQASAKQRAGRAGRNQAGDCIRLYTSFTFNNEFEKAATPEILRSNLGSVVLQLKAIGIDNLLAFQFVDRPPKSALVRSIEHLLELGAINRQTGEMTEVGRKMAEFPIEPALAKCVVVSPKYRCATEMAMIAAVLSLDGGLFLSPMRGGGQLQPRKFGGRFMSEQEQRQAIKESRDNLFAGALPGTMRCANDLFGYVMVFRVWLEKGCDERWTVGQYLNHKKLLRARDVYNQILKTMDRLGMRRSRVTAAEAKGKEGDSSVTPVIEYGVQNTEDIKLTLPQLNRAITLCLLEGFFNRLAKIDKLDNRTYELIPKRIISTSDMAHHRQLLNAALHIRTFCNIHPTSCLSINREDAHTAKEQSIVTPPGWANGGDTDEECQLKTCPKVIMFLQMRQTGVGLNDGGGEEWGDFSDGTNRPYLCHLCEIVDIDDVRAVLPTQNYYNMEDLHKAFS